MALTGVSVASQGGALATPRSSSHLKVTLLNANAFPVGGIALLEEAVAGGRRIDARCISAPPGGQAVLTLTLDAAALAELELRERYRVRLVLSLSAADGLGGTVASTYSIEQTLRPTGSIKGHDE